MKTDNVIIAEFMGYTYYPYRDDEKGMAHGWINSSVNRKFPAGLLMKSTSGYLCRNHGQLRYDTSWDWLMPVISKCWDLCDQWTATQFDFDSISDPLQDIDINETFKAVVAFIKWYNSSKV